jgi:hypothetical protein
VIYIVDEAAHRPRQSDAAQAIAFDLDQKAYDSL